LASLEKAEGTTKKDGGRTAAAVTSAPVEPQLGHLLDIGAGEGRVTAALAPLFRTVTATEVTPKLVDLLNSKGFRAVLSFDPSPATIPPPNDEPAAGGATSDAPAADPTASPQQQVAAAPRPRRAGIRRRKSQSVALAAADAAADSAAGGARGKFDVVSLLNVLDRCSKPLTMLRRMRELVRDDGGLVLMAVVLPFRASVETRTGCEPPDEPLPKLERARSFESSLVLLADTLRDHGLEVVVWSRIPYLSMSLNWLDDYAVLSDAVLVCRKVDRLV
ncbi:Methyltransferase-like protein 9, partial [Cladochytrium tenue]